VGWLPLSVSQAIRKTDVKIVSWSPQLDSRMIDNVIARVINNSDKCLLNQIVRASASRTMKCCTFGDRIHVPRIVAFTDGVNRHCIGTGGHLTI